jgi:hypothetical protein
MKIPVASKEPCRAVLLSKCIPYYAITKPSSLAVSLACFLVVGLLDAVAIELHILVSTSENDLNESNRMNQYEMSTSFLHTPYSHTTTNMCVKFVRVNSSCRCVTQHALHYCHHFLRSKGNTHPYIKTINHTTNKINLSNNADDTTKLLKENNCKE